MKSASKKMKKTAVILVPLYVFLEAAAALYVFLVAPSALAQTAEEYKRRQGDLTELAAIFGDLHNIRRHCEPQLEADAWRNRMKRIIELEQPKDAQRQEMIAAFNKAYQKSRKRFPQCNRRAKDFAAQRAASAQPIIERLTAPLYANLDNKADAGEDGQTTIWRGRNRPAGGNANTTDQ